MRLFLCAVLFVCCTCIVARTTAAKQNECVPLCFSQTLSPERALSLAYRSRSSLEAQEQESRSLRLGERVALSGLLPQIKLENFFLTGTPGTFGKHEMDIIVRQQLVNFGGPLFEFSIAQQKTHISECEEWLEEDKIRKQVEQSLLELWRLQRQKDFVDSAVEAATSRLEREGHRGSVGDLDIPAVAQVHARYKTVMAEAANYLSDIREARVDLRGAMERCVDQPLDAGALCSFVQRSISAAYAQPVGFYLDKAYCNRKEICVKDAEVREQEYRETFFSRFYYPSVSFYVNFNRSGAAGLFQGSSGGSSSRSTVVSAIWRMGVRFDWEFDGFASVHQTKAAEFTLCKVLAERRDVMRTVRQEVEAGHEVVKRALNDVEAAVDQLNAAQRLFDKQKAQYHNGLITLADFVDAKREYERAKFGIDDTRVKAADTYRDLLARCGYPNDIEHEVVTT